MNNDYEQYITMSEFAKLCGVTKFTLFHYDKIGILKPEMVDDKGYRFYSLRQLSIYDIITVLKQVGMPLKVIKGYLENQDTHFFLKILAQKKLQLDKQLKEIKKMQKFLQSAIDTTNYALAITGEQPRLEDRNEEYLIVADISQELSSREQMQKIYDQYHYCEQNDVFISLVVGFIISKDSINNGEYHHADYFFCTTDSKHNCESLHIKPAGKYAIIDHEGPREEISASYEKLKAYIAQHHLEIVGNTYECNLLNSLAGGKPENYITEIVIEVK
ncbi:MerR family transcriptional regulator [Clostridium sp. D2Q-14]|uniref:MerR family transcriptional regulator n=1 Tax=Anaeromonas gelatinilytica TaxID=2683194 RepID=UPI00193B8B9C|nr:MerR family transcriptional regulator [Anaeromonas gelatinilytica]MBS4534037.1 MerR family transcriptional regulator [Anaeromonas gelatinilytica]